MLKNVTWEKYRFKLLSKAQVSLQADTKIYLAWGKFTFEFLLFNKFIIHEPLLYHSSIYSIKCREPSLFIFQTFVYKRNTSRNKLERKTWVERSEAGNLVERDIGQYPQFVDSAWKQRGKKNTENEYFHGLVWKNDPEPKNKGNRHAENPTISAYLFVPAQSFAPRCIFLI